MLLLIDASNLWARAWYATRHEAMTADGESTAGLVVFTNILSRHIREEKPDRVVVCWDGGGSAYRLRLLPSYKANRMAKHTAMRSGRDQVHEFLALAGVDQVERVGVEADDLISRYWYDAQEPVTIVSEDKDFLQLAGPNPQGHPCVILRSTGECWTEEKVLAELGATPRHLPAVMALTGDVSDNVIGVPGIGPKKAVSLLEEAGWELESIDHPEVAQMLPQVLLNRVLVNLRVPIPGLLIPPPPVFRPTGPLSSLYAELVGFLERYRLRGLLSKLFSGSLWTEDEQLSAPIA